MNAIEIEGLSKKYGSSIALNDINLKVAKGSIYGIVGPNGSGKTTLIKLLVGSLVPNSGSIKILGLNPTKDKMQLRRQIGYMPQKAALYEDMSVKENILFFGKAQDVADLEKKTNELVSFAELTDKEDHIVGTFSEGMKKRVSLCCALINEPKIIFLDEPTAAIDPHLKMMSWNMYRKLANNGVTIIVTTHLMDEVMLCDKVTILNKGELLVVDTPQNILQQGKTSLNITTQDKEKCEVIDSTSECLATALKRYGLDTAIMKVDLFRDNIQDIILQIINNKSNI